MKQKISLGQQFEFAYESLLQICIAFICGIEPTTPFLKLRMEYSTHHPRPGFFSGVCKLVLLWRKLYGCSRLATPFLLLSDVFIIPFLEAATALLSDAYRFSGGQVRSCCRLVMLILRFIMFRVPFRQPVCLWLCCIELVFKRGC